MVRFLEQKTQRKEFENVESVPQIKHSTREQQATAYGKWLRAVLDEHKIRVIDLSDRSGFHANVIQNWLSGRTLPNGYSLAVVSTALSQMLNRQRSDILEEIAVTLLKS